MTLSWFPFRVILVHGNPNMAPRHEPEASKLSSSRCRPPQRPPIAGYWVARDDSRMTTKPTLLAKRPLHQTDRSGVRLITPHISSTLFINSSPIPLFFGSPYFFSSSSHNALCYTPPRFVDRSRSRFRSRPRSPLSMRTGLPNRVAGRLWLHRCP